MVELEGSKRKRAAKNNRDECSDRSKEVKLLATFGNYDNSSQPTD